MKLAVIATLLASATAFAPNQQAASSSALSAASKWDGKVGVQAPLGYFDPLKLLVDADESQFEQMRAQELKHGRIAQLAFLGNIVVLSGARFPGFLSNTENIKFSDLPSHGIEAISKVPTAGLAQIALFITCVEIGSSQLKGEFKGDYTSIIDFGWAKQTDAWKKKKMSIELNNGRAAMMGIWGLVTHELIGNLDSMPIVGGV
jgi:Chlorophyll A-B binding protein